MIVVHHLENSRSHRIVWLLEELGIDYEIRNYKRDPKSLAAPASLRAVHPLGKSPIITDGDTVVAESGAIIEYLLELYDNKGLRPAIATPEGRRHAYWLHYAEGSLMPLLVMSLVFRKIETQRVPFFVKPVVTALVGQVRKRFLSPQLATHLDFLEAELATRDWFSGDSFTAADVQMSYPVEAARERGGLDATRPRLMRFLERIRSRPAYQRARTAGGALDFGRLME